MKCFRTAVLPAAIFLFFGLAGAQASTDRCVVEGGVDLRIQGDERQGWVTGWIGQERFSADIWMSRLTGDIQGLRIRLYVDPMNQQDYQLSGWIGGTYVNWRSFNGWVSAGYACLN